MQRPAGAQPVSPDPPATTPGARRGRAIAAAVGGSLLLALLVSYAGVGPVLERLRLLGWSAPLILLPYLVINVLDTRGWRCTLPARGATLVPFRALYFIRMAGEAVNSVTPTAAIGGEPVKAYLLHAWGVPSSDGVASVVIAKTALTISQVAFILVGLAVFFDRRDEGAVGVGLVAFLVLFAAFLTFFVVRLQRRGPVSTVWRWLRRLAPRARFVGRLEEKAQAIDDRLADFYRIERRSFLSASLWHFTAWMLGVAEIQLMMTLIGAPIPWRDALILESLSQPIRASSIVVPGGIGVQEVGGVALCRLLGIPEAVGVTLWLLKRARELVFDAIGLAYLTRHTATRAREALGP